ncbi:MAG TPA: methionyl-tRNA formyltransferase [bacterium]|nr:methionyl-tRNA formyltransferase [bacterium]
MKIIYFGSDEFGIPSLYELKKNFNLLTIITTPDKPKGRGQKVLPTPTKIWAIENKIEVLTPAEFDENFISKLKSLNPDLIVLISYGKKLPVEILKIPKLCSINLHPSLLPKYRGPAPIEWCLINGEEETGITVIKMEENIDAGEIIEQRKFPILPDDDAITLKNRLSNEGSKILISAIEKIKKGERGEKQKGIPSYARKLKKEDGKINWEKSAKDIHNLVRGVIEWPTAYTYIETKNGKKLIKIFKTEIEKESGKFGMIGEIIKIGNDFIEVACGNGTIKIKQLQMEGKKRIETSEFLKGFHYPLTKFTN